MTPAWEDRIEGEDREAIANWSVPYQLRFLAANVISCNYASIPNTSILGNTSL